MILSYTLGILFFMLSVFILYEICIIIFPQEYWIAVVCVLLFVLDKWMNFIAVSGMETTMFIFLLLLCYYFYKKRNAIFFGLTLGLIFWVRPDGIAFISAVIIDYITFLYYKKLNPKINGSIPSFSKKDLIKISLIFIVLLFAYFTFNLTIGGSLLPNTFAAKLAFYSPGRLGRSGFLTDQLWPYFTESNYVLIIIPFIVSIIFIFSDCIKKKYNILLLPLLFIFLLIFIYWFELPYAFRFGRYVMPLIPFYIILSIYASLNVFRYLYKITKSRNFAIGIIFIFLSAVIIYFVVAYNNNKFTYQDYTNQMIQTRVITGKWIKNNTPEDAIICTHEVGAIAFYSQRKIVDVAGLINPEFINKLYTPDFTDFIIEHMKKQNVSYIAFLQEWFIVTNENPLFVTTIENTDKMFVYKFEPGEYSYS